MTIQDKEMLNDLVVESREHLSEIEPDLLELEQKGDGISGDLINRIFRAIHSIKGGFGFFGIEHVTKLSHAMENVMSKVRDKKLSISPELTDALLKGVDKLRMLLDDVAHAGEVKVDEEIDNLKPFLGEAGSLTPTASLRPPGDQLIDSEAALRRKHENLTDEQIVDAVRNGKLLYQLSVNTNMDCAPKKLTPAALFESWEKMGCIMDVLTDTDAIPGLKGSSGMGLKLSVVYASVLEPDLISVGTGIPDERIFALDTSKIKTALLGETAKNNTAEAADQGAQVAAADSATMIKLSPDKTQKVETKMEDALRVKVNLLNNLMNLAGELVLSRNQLMQSVNRKLSDAMESETFFKNIDRQIEQSCATMIDAIHQNPASAAQTAEKEKRRLHEAFSQGLSMRLIDVSGLNGIMQNIDMVTSLLQESIMQTRLQPISVVFAKFPRLIRDLAKKLGKEVNLTLVGQDVELDKSIVEQLSDPLTHLIRNSVDHGVEGPEVRKKTGKPVLGEVVLRAFHEGGKVHIQIKDDGAGINRERVKEKALSLGIVTQEEAGKMTDREIDSIIMLPGFSTASAVSDVSGRGVGMDVVKTNIERLGGLVDVESTPGQGTIITMKLPLTLAIISSLIVSAGGRRFAIPQVGIEELVRIRAKDVTGKIDRLKECEVMRLRGKLLPLVRLDQVLGMTPSFCRSEKGERREELRKRWSDRRSLPEEKTEEAVGEHGQGDTDAMERREKGPDRRKDLSNAVKIIVLKFGDRHFGLVVEEVYDSEEIVVKPLSGYLKSCPCYAGSTIMGDGSVAMILDTNGIAAASGLKFGELEKDMEIEKEKFLKESSRASRELLLFSAGENGNFGVDLSSVARVEKVEASRINAIGGKEFLKYEDRSMRLLRLSDYLPVNGSAGGSTHAFIIVPKGVKHVMGIIADLVKDVVKIDAELDKNNIRGAGIQGSAIINSALTVVIDVNEIFKTAEPQLY
jgi:two-component system chemotaxis sensor kinase CheA